MLNRKETRTRRRVESMAIHVSLRIRRVYRYTTVVRGDGRMISLSTIIETTCQTRMPRREEPTTQICLRDIEII
jgi:hypothetical protein